ncbi:YoaK family protein [Arthrobacter sp. H14-L1]|uniref:YoaK family protein n=1 Tax=Arthrobacter sp. H14-L1 TaxID=2996697 RepID=UPI00226EDDFE|nr:YoaK family protein [Arthrobacter sp. H14-L1]MCY0904919.1 YoaK family protein [Arthrobacter sp. H14-L1]
MHRHHRTEIMLAAGLSAVAGFVDAIGFIHLGGYFVSFMSGNSTRAGALLADGSWFGVLLAGGLVAAFLAGVISGSLLRGAVPVHKRVVILLSIAVVLAAAAVLFDAGFWVALVPPMMAFAMGAENVVFERDGEVSIGLTYMTGTLVKMGQRVASALAGGEKLGWLRYFLLWFALTCGSVVGGLTYHALSLDALWFAAAGILAAAVISRRLPVPG